jgi:hypothetical protein
MKRGIMPIQVQLFASTGFARQHPQSQVYVPPPYKIVGGGAIVHWSGSGNLLTASYPVFPNWWIAAAKDHLSPSPASITAYALAIYDPADEWDVRIATAAGGPANHPRATAALPSGYVLTGGGALVHWTGAGNLLTASFPSTASSWEARAKDHGVSSPAWITAYAIGIRHRSGVARVAGTIRSVNSAPAPHPATVACLDAGWILTGGGALDHWTGAGNLLTASYPLTGSPCWRASGKDHIYSSPALLTGYAVGIREV